MIFLGIGLLDSMKFTGQTSTVLWGPVDVKCRFKPRQIALKIGEKSPSSVGPEYVFNPLCVCVCVCVCVYGSNCMYWYRMQ